jgi:hypothetical protein
MAGDILKRCIEHANEHYDGHLTLLKFTTNYRFCFGTLHEVNQFTTSEMAKGKTMEEAMEVALKENINAWEIEYKHRGDINVSLCCFEKIQEKEEPHCSHCGEPCAVITAAQADEIMLQQQDKQT